MRALLLCLALAGCAQAQPARAETAPRPAIETSYEVPDDRGAQMVHVVTRDIPPGGEIPWHTHPGIEIGYVESGEVEFLSAGAAPRRLGPGEEFTALRGLVHAGRNPGSAPARIVITYVVDKYAPLRMPADPPTGP